MNYAHAPREALERVVALRLHLDDSNENNGPLRVLPGTHQSGVLTDEEVLRLAEKISGVECLVAQGGVVIMRPLVIHASSKATSNGLDGCYILNTLRQRRLRRTGGGRLEKKADSSLRSE